MNEVWAHKWMNNSKTMIMFSNRFISSNIIYTIEDLRSAIEEKGKTFRQVPISLIEKVMREARFLSLKTCFKTAIAA